uniref:DNA-directed RNA polymerase subunit beta n=1 Tax=Trebouxia lynnae TaxID=1825957 RepID=A0A6B9VR04_9CHLO|nr:beta subunit of RNA polymerase [Trebouxia lynnae]QHO63935.1 beta subunit of RNA polymerase [Trebouxia lynnae]
MRFHENLVYSFIPDFVDIQRKSFSALLKKGFIRELANRNPITNATHDLELFFYPQFYQLNRPECTPTEAILKSKSYSCKLYVPVQLTNRQSNEIKLQWVLLGNLPLMTKRGHFIINGSPRVVINQLVRSPGIYYHELIDVKKRKTYYADLISLRGAWLRLEIDKKQRVWARMKKTPKISALVFLQALDFTEKQIKSGIRFSDFLKYSYLEEDHPDTTEQALISLYEKSHPTISKTLSVSSPYKKNGTQGTLSRGEKDKSQVTPIMGQKFLFRKFMNPRTYNLGLLGRMRLNKKFGLLISEKQLTLTRHDIFCAIDYLINLKYGITSVDDIDNLKNRRVKASGELVQNQLSTGLIRLEKTIREKMKKVKKGLTIHNLITTKPINGALREFFGSSPLSQYLDQTNPLAEITHKRRLSSLGPGGISRETAGMAIRSIHPTHYGRICPIETPEGRNAGLVNSITIHAKINEHGFLKTPFYNVYQGQIQKQDSSLRDARPIFFSAEQEEVVKIAPGDLKASKLNFLPTTNIPIRIEKDYYRVSREQVEYIAMSPIQMISIATSLIPFLEHDDANRALMGSNMQRQAVPVILPERPIVGTGLEGRVAADSGYVVQSKMGGYVSYASGKKIVILEKNNSNIFTISNKLKYSNTNVFAERNESDFPSNSVKKKRSFVSFQTKETNFKTKIQKVKNCTENNLDYKFFNLKTESLINLLFLFLNQSSDFTPNFLTNLENKSLCPLKSTILTPFSDKVLLKTLRVETKGAQASHQTLVLRKNLCFVSGLLKVCLRFETASSCLLKSKILKALSKRGFLCLKDPSAKKGEGVFFSNSFSFQTKDDFLRKQKDFSLMGLSLTKGDVNQNNNQSLTPCPLPQLGHGEYSLQNYQRSNQDTCLAQRPTVLEGEWVQKGDLLADCSASVSGDLSLGKNILVAYMPWEGYNFEDAILISERLVYDDIYTSLHIERYEVEIRDTKFGVEQISNIIPEVSLSEILHLDDKGIARVGSWVEEGNILIGKVTPIKKKSLSPHEKLLYDIVGKKIPTTRNTSLRVPKGVEGRVISVEILETESIPPGISFAGPGRVHIFLAEKRKIQVGDKISGRHGNKGIVSKIIPRQDMPYLPNGTPIDMVLNPLGVPSRMNVGQIFEALLGLAGLYLNQSFKVPSFDEMYGPEASRSIIYSKLFQARLKSGQKWLFDPNFPGKTRVFDGRTGQCFDQLVTVGQTYMLKLVHLVDDKIHARSTGPYSLVTQQPLGGRAKHGGQRLGEMEVWALEGFGAAYTLQELLTIKSDDIQGRHKVINAILTDAPLKLGIPESFKVLIRELQSLCLNIETYTYDSNLRVTPIDVTKLP